MARPCQFDDVQLSVFVRGIVAEERLKDYNRVEKGSGQFWRRKNCLLFVKVLKIL